MTAAPDFHSGLPRWRVAINASGWVWDALAPLVDSAAVACCTLQEAVQLDEPTDLVVYETDPLEEDQLQAALSAPGLLTASCLFLGKPPSLQDPRRQSETLQAKDGDAVAEAVARLLGAPHEAGLAPAPVSDDEPPAQTEQPLVAPEAPPPPTFATSGSLRSRPAPLLPSSLPPGGVRGDLGQRMPTLPPALEGPPGDELLEPPAELSAEVADLLEQMEQRVGRELQPRSVAATPPVVEDAAFNLTPELEAALAEPIGEEDVVAAPSSKSASTSPESSPPPLVPTRHPTQHQGPRTGRPASDFATGTLAVTTRPPATGHAPSFRPLPRDSAPPPPEAAAVSLSVEEQESLAPPPPALGAAEPVTARPPPAARSQRAKEPFSMPRAPALPRDLTAPQQAPLSEGGADSESYDIAPETSPFDAEDESPAPPATEVGVPNGRRRSLPPIGSAEFTSGESTPLGSDAAAELLARAIRSRVTGMLEYESADIVRRVILREGDIVTAVSSAQDESLVAYLAHRSMIDADTAEHLSYRLPSFGRHAGAALIASGVLPQQELWPTLRAHAEYVIGHTLQLTDGVVGYESEVPERLRAEPSVFGGHTGCEVFVELLKRTLAPEAAQKRLGNRSVRLTAGPGISLLDECELSRTDSERVHFALTVDLGQALDEAREPELACTLYALVLLGVLAPSAERAPVPARPDADDRLDTDALRRAIVLRRRLVDNADYFTLLGVPRHATGYEVRRAYLELRRTLDPSVAITHQTIDLREDLELILTVLDEAFEILSDGPKRERYRRALDSAPAPSRP